MGVNKILFSILFLFSSVLAMGQGFVYSYNDPCTSKTKQIYVNTPNNSIVLTYGGEIRVFTYEELQTNAVQNWINSVNSQNPSGPCTGLGLQLNTTMNSLVAQNSISVLTNVLSVLTDLDSDSGSDDEDDENTTNKNNEGQSNNQSGATQLVTTTTTTTTTTTNSNSTNQLNNTTNNNTTNNNINNNNNNNSGVSNSQIGSTNSNNQSNSVAGNNQPNISNNSNSNNQSITTNEKQIVSNSYGSQTQTVSNNNITNNSNNNGENNNSQNANNTTGIGTSNTVGNSSNTNSNQGTSDSKGNQTVDNGAGGNNQNQGNVNTTATNTTTTGKQEVESNLNVNQTSNNPIKTDNQQQQTSNNNNNSTSVGQQESQRQRVPVNNQTTSTLSNQNNVTNNQPSTNNNGAITNITGSVNSIRVDNSEQSDTKDKDKDAANNALMASSLSSSSVKNKVSNAKKGNLIMNGDVVVIGSATATEPNQFRFNASIVSSNTKNTFAKGALINFTSYINNSNVTLFVSYRYKKFTSILANSTMMNFDKDLFNTISIMESYKYRKVTTTLGLNLTSGNLGSSKFQSISVLGGVFSDFKVNKKIKMTTMFVMVYSPYVYYYQGMWYDSGYLAIPFVSGDYKITKKFKLNISFSGVQQLNDKPLTYQILTGAKAIL